MRARGRFIVGARVGNRGASWPFCYLRIEPDCLWIRGWPIPWFAYRRIPKDEIGVIVTTTVLGSPVLRIYDRAMSRTGNAIGPPVNFYKVIDALRQSGYKVEWASDVFP